MKRCSRCKTEKPLSDFGTNKSKKDRLQTSCKDCRKIYNHNYYMSSPEQNTNRQASNLRNKQRNRDYVYNYLLEHPCVDCKESDIVVLEFDHVRDTKIDNISSMISFPCNLEKIQEEIDKCEIRCANCHKRKTAERAGWDKWLRSID